MADEVLQLQPEIMDPAGATVEWTTLSRTQYGRLFKSISKPPPPVVDPAGPAAIPESIDENARLPEQSEGEKDAEEMRVIASHETAPLKFAFAPDIAALINPTSNSLVRRSAPFEVLLLIRCVAATGNGFSRPPSRSHLRYAYSRRLRCCGDSSAQVATLSIVLSSVE